MSEATQKREAQGRRQSPMSPRGHSLPIRLVQASTQCPQYPESRHYISAHYLSRWAMNDLLHCKENRRNPIHRTRVIWYVGHRKGVRHDLPSTL